MRVFLTGATGFVGSVVAEKLQQAGHQVAALARSDASADALAARGIAVVRGDLEATEEVAAAARAADGVVHTAFALDGGDFGAAVATERRVVRAMLDALDGTGKPLVITSGTALLGDTGDRVFDEETPIPAPAPGDQGTGALRARLAVEPRGVRGVVLRPPNVYGRTDGRSILTMLRLAGRALGAVPYAAGTGDHRWSFVHVDDLADLYVLALERAGAGELFHAAGESGLRTGAIAEALSQGIGLEGRTVELELPALAQALGVPPMAGYWASNSQSSGEKARRVLGWRPAHVHMLADVARPAA